MGCTSSVTSSRPASVVKPVFDLIPLTSSKLSQREVEESVAYFQQARETLLKSPETLSHLAAEAREWALANGLIMCKSDGSVTHAPCTLIPRIVLREKVDELMNMSKILNSLFDQLARDPKFIIPMLESAANADSEFTGKILKLYEECLTEGIVQTNYLGIHRSDYMEVDSNTNLSGWAHIEFNTIASSFGPLGDKVVRLHDFLLTRHLHLQHPQLVNPQNGRNISQILATAAKKVHKNDPTVLMIVQPGDRNFTDQRLLEFELWNMHRVRLFRRTLKQIFQNGTLENKELVIQEEIGSKISFRVSVAYYRYGYHPRDYPSNDEWLARRMIERSRAIKCPNAIYHLLGSKTVQPILAKQGVLERYLKPEDCLKLRRVFVGMTNLDPALEDKESISTVLADVIKKPEDFVLKPQREGGGCNFYGKAIPEQLKQLSEDERKGYMIMERVRPPVTTSVHMREGKVSVIPSVSEVGIYSVYLGDGKEELVNRTAGILCRTKEETMTEGGVASGYAVIDSLFLI